MKNQSLYLIHPGGITIKTNTICLLDEGSFTSNEFHYYPVYKLIILDLANGIQASGTHLLQLQDVSNPVSDNADKTFELYVIDNYEFVNGGSFAWPGGTYILGATSIFDVKYKTGSLSLPYEVYTVSFTTKMETAAGGKISVIFPDSYDFVTNVPTFENIVGLLD